MLFDRNMEPSCSYCQFGTALGNEEFVCIKRGIMDRTGSCGAFRYEPTKRIPEATPKLKVSGLTEEDFTL